MPTTPIIVKLNLRVSSYQLGTISENFSYYDPLTGVNLNKGNQTSADISGFSQANLINIANSVHLGTISCTSGANELPPYTAAYTSYNNYSRAGAAGTGLLGTGITGVAAADAFENNF